MNRSAAVRSAAAASRLSAAARRQRASSLLAISSSVSMMPRSRRPPRRSSRSSSITGSLPATCMPASTAMWSSRRGDSPSTTATRWPRPKPISPASRQAVHSALAWSVDSTGDSAATTGAAASSDANRVPPPSSPDTITRRSALRAPRRSARSASQRDASAAPFGVAGREQRPERAAGGVEAVAVLGQQRQGQRLPGHHQRGQAPPRRCVIGVGGLAEALRQPGAGGVGVDEQHPLAGLAPAAGQRQPQRPGIEAGVGGGRNR